MWNKCAVPSSASPPEDLPDSVGTPATRENEESRDFLEKRGKLESPEDKAISDPWVTKE